MKYVAVLGPIRAGKTLIGRALNAHHAMSVQQEPFFFFFKLCRDIFERDILKNGLDPARPLCPDFCVPGPERALFERSFPELCFNEADIKELRRLTARQQESAGEERAPLVLPLLDRIPAGTAPEVFDSLLYILAAAYPKEHLQYVGFTEAWCDKFAAPLMNLPGREVYCINAVRDPRAVIASRNAGRNLMEKYGGRYPLLFLIRHWRSSAGQAIANRSSGRYLTVRYEDLIADPQCWFEKICSHVQAPFDAAMLHPESFLNGAGKPWKPNTNFEAGRGFSTGSLERWRETLSKQEIGFIEWLCRPEMEYLGYEITQPDFSLHDVTSFREDAGQIIAWLRPYNLTITPEAIALEITRRSLLADAEPVSEEMIHYLFGNKKTYSTFAESFKPGQRGIPYRE